MAKRKAPSIVWINDNLIKILPVNSETIYFTDYTDTTYQKISGVRWRVMKGYLQGWIDKKSTMLHHLILPKQEGFLCDHINRNKADNRRCNLRHVNRHESGINRNVQSSNKSGFMGVHWHRDHNKWRAKIRVNGKIKHLGHFNTPEEASTAYQQALNKYYPGVVREVMHGCRYSNS